MSKASEWAGAEYSAHHDIGVAHLRTYHTAAWPDGFEVTRIAVLRGGQLVIRIRYAGRIHEVRLGKRVAEFKADAP
jgi:hypothetical protein